MTTDEFISRLAAAKLPAKSDADIISTYHANQKPFRAMADLLRGRSPQQVIGELRNHMTLDEMSDGFAALFSSIIDINSKIVRAIGILAYIEEGENAEEK